MLSAYVLIETEVGKGAHVARALGEVDGVEVAEDLTGPYDVIARIQASSLDQLGRLVVSRIQVVDGVWLKRPYQGSRDILTRSANDQGRSLGAIASAAV
jgi:DNA-binding Lrp family transcriptional regulator